MASLYPTVPTFLSTMPEGPTHRFASGLCPKGLDHIILDERYRRRTCLVFVNAYVQVLFLANYLVLNSARPDNPEKLSEMTMVEQLWLEYRRGVK